MASSSALQLSLAQTETIAALAEECVHKPYPYALMHVMQEDSEAQPPRALHPAFYGCFDWHSAVHGHWLLARVAHLYPASPMAARARALLAKSFSAENLRGELAYLQAHPGFERPYGIAWLLQLGAELRAWRDPDTQHWSARLQPLEAHAAQVLTAWLGKSNLAVRAGTHANSAFALGLALDWADISGHGELQTAIHAAAMRFYHGDANCPIEYEPSAHDFLSPCLAEADLMRRVLAEREFQPWLERFLTGLSGDSGILKPAVVTDPTDGHMVHLDGLNLSRAWMMRNIGLHLPAEHPIAVLLLDAAERHAQVGLQAIVDPHYAGSHWLGTFAIYMATQAGAASAD
jgi:hypothetical protein